MDQKDQQQNVTPINGEHANGPANGPATGPGNNPTGPDRVTNANKIYTLVCFDGVERQIRWTVGAARLIRKNLNEPSLVAILEKQGEFGIIEASYYMLYDEHGNPPPFTVGRYLFSTPPSNSPVIVGAVLECASEGKLEKNETEAMLRKALEIQTKREVERWIGSPLSPSPTNVSESVTGANTTGDLPLENSEQSQTSGGN